MGTLGDLLVLGEGPSVVDDADVDLLGRACELLWSRAVAATVDLCIKVKKSNVDFWANVHRKCKRNSNFPH